MGYRNVCRRGRASGGRVRQDDIRIIDDILPRLAADERQQISALRRTDPAAFRNWVEQYKAEHRAQIREIIQTHDAGGASPGILRFIE